MAHSPGVAAVSGRPTSAATTRTALDLQPGEPVDREDRKRFAVHAVHHPLKRALFALLDSKDIKPGLWRQARPEGTWTPSGRIFSEDTA